MILHLNNHCQVKHGVKNPPDIYWQHVWAFSSNQFIISLRENLLTRVNQLPASAGWCIE
jgi:hypothetical protein